MGILASAKRFLRTRDGNSPRVRIGSDYRVLWSVVAVMGSRRPERCCQRRVGTQDDIADNRLLRDRRNHNLKRYRFAEEMIWLLCNFNAPS